MKAIGIHLYVSKRLLTIFDLVDENSDFYATGKFQCAGELQFTSIEKVYVLDQLEEKQFEKLLNWNNEPENVLI